MTAQVPDSVTYEGTQYAIVGVSGTGLFDPVAHGLRPVALNTGNWRGFVCRYEVREGQLHLSTLRVGIAFPEPPRESPPRLFGTEAAVSERGFEATYEFEHAPIAFSGGLLLGDGFIPALYRHMGFHAGWKFERVVELIFEEGALERAHDHSERVAQIRTEIADGQRPDPDGDPNVARWIARTFELSYARTFG